MIRYGEIALKSPRVRSRFERTLGSNITSRFIKSGKECRLEFERGRIFLWADNEDYAIWVLARTFGIVSFSKVLETTSKPDDIYNLAVDISKPLFKKGLRFCIRARRSGEHKFTSMEIAKETGSAVFLANEHLQPKVDLTNPELEIFVDVRNNRAYVYTGNISGPGGMPLGTQGRVLGIVREEKDIAACWLVMKRGCTVIMATDDISLLKPLESWNPEPLTHVLDGSDDIATIARKRRTDGVCLGWDVETFDKRSSETEGLVVPVFYPIMGMSSQEVGELVAMIGA
ncbi:MAG: THUMP domain-containing protein [Thermoplasmata archaeon]|nr:THUMP domain-containing protein [Thermoplasmata archaeon]